MEICVENEDNIDDIKIQCSCSMHEQNFYFISSLLYGIETLHTDDINLHNTIELSTPIISRNCQ